MKLSDRELMLLDHALFLLLVDCKDVDVVNNKREIIAEAEEMRRRIAIERMSKSDAS